MILAFEASKAAVDLEAPATGFLRHAAAKGEVVPVGAVEGVSRAQCRRKSLNR